MITEALYQQRCSEPCDINEHLPTFVAICQELEATRVIELGVRHGISTIGWLYGLQLTDGHLWSVDITNAYIPGPDDRWTFIEGDDLAPEVIVQLPERVDVVFIDTSHTFQRTADELVRYGPKVRPGGRIVLHDTEVEVPEHALPDDPPFPVKTAVEEFCDLRQLQWRNRSHNNGLATILIPG